MKKWINVAKILKFWNAYISVKDTKEWLDKVDVDSDGKIQFKDLILFLIGLVK